eukprot:COSAG01_NODE_2715_length_7199_cov_15.544507_6_plen_118_part_00
MCDVYSPDKVGGTLVNVASYCGASNSQFQASASDGSIRLVDPQHSQLGQCLHAAQCSSSSTPPCSLPSSWGSLFSVLVIAAAVLYHLHVITIYHDQDSGSAEIDLRFTFCDTDADNH